MIKLDKLNKYYNRGKANEIHVIDNTSLILPDRGLVALLGPSGCGKTTLLNAIGGLDKVDAGKIIVDGDRITGVSSGKIDETRNAKIGYIFQNFNLLEDKTVFENVAIALKMVGLKDKELFDERVNYCLKAVGIYQYRNKRADALSGGQRQRVAIARAIVKNPKIIIADEPTGNLDSANTLEIMNIIKSISADRLVVLVTHEEKLANFYSDWILKLKDGKIIDSASNDSSKYLDYQLENKIYLKDINNHQSLTDGSVRIDVYGDKEPELEIKLVIRDGSIIIDTGGRYNIVGEDSNIELIDDNYKQLDESVYEKNKFKYDEYMPENFRAKYTSVYSPLHLLRNGFKNVKAFKKSKKFLLIGFVFAAAFTFAAVANIMGIIDVQPEDFLMSNSNYVSVSNSKQSLDLINKTAATEGCEYVIPGDSRIAVSLPLDDYLQTSNASQSINVSVTRLSTISKEDIAYGRMPENDQEVLLDAMSINKFTDRKLGVTVGLTEIEQFLGRRITVPNLQDYTIVGITDLHSPSLYVADGQVMYLLTNGLEPVDDSGVYIENAAEDSSNDKIIDVALRPAALVIKKGRMPENDYEVIASYSHYGEYELDKTIDRRMNGQKLKVVGFYESDTTQDIYYVSANTVYLNYLSKQKVASAYTKDTGALIEKLKAQDISAQSNYDSDKKEYVDKMRDSLKSSLIVSGILLLVSMIEMYLMLRSSFLARIKEVGTMRAIGLKKRDVYRMFAGEIIVISLITAIPGIALSYYIMSNVVRISSFIESLYIITPFTALISLALIILFNLLAGLIPVFRTMRKTPAQILARTDI